VIKIGKLPFQFALGGRYWADTPEAGPQGGNKMLVDFYFSQIAAGYQNAST